jgi:hypothetical protein
MMRHLLLVLLVAAGMALGTWWLGWWVVPVLGAGWGAARHGPRPAATVAAAAALAWMALLALGALRGPAGEVSRLVGDALGTPGWVPLALVVAYPAGLAGAAARLSTILVARFE